MDIEHCITEETASHFSKQYHSAIEQGDICPDLIRTFPQVIPGEGVIIVYEDTAIHGLLQYIQPNISSSEQLRDRQQLYHDDDTPFSGDILEHIPFNEGDDVCDLVSIENVSRRPGIGRLLVEWLEDLVMPELVLVRSIPEAVGFYEKIGFTHSRLYASQGNCHLLFKRPSYEYLKTPSHHAETAIYDGPIA